MNASKPIQSLASATFLFAALLFAQSCGGGVSGTYEASAPQGQEGSAVLELKGDRTANLSLSSGKGFGMTVSGKWSSSGDQVTISVAEGGKDDELVLTKKGGKLEGQVFGDQLTFHKR